MVAGAERGARGAVPPLLLVVVCLLERKLAATSIGDHVPAFHFAARLLYQ
jgi:hypothetical protein